MHRRSRGTSLAPRPLPILLLTAALGGLLVAACGGGPSSPPSSAPTTTTAAPTGSPRLPTPVPTAPVTPAPSDSSPNPTPETTSLLIRLTTCSHACGPEAGTTILDDGRIVWQDEELRVFESRLSPEALADARAEIEGLPELAASADYRPELRPGAEPIGHGTTLYRFDRFVDGVPIHVTTTDPRSLADQPDAWIIPPESFTLADLADHLADPVAWLGAKAMAEPIRPYSPQRYLLVVELFPDLDDVAFGDVDVDDVDWPIGSPIDTVGEPIAAGDFGPESRCLLIDAATARAMAAEEARHDRTRDLAQWHTSQEYGWERAAGFVTVYLTALLPHETGDCAELVVTPP